MDYKFLANLPLDGFEGEDKSTRITTVAQSHQDLLNLVQEGHSCAIWALQYMSYGEFPATLSGFCDELEFLSDTESDDKKEI